MQKILITDMTLRETEQDSASAFSFKEQIEISKLLEKLGVDIIETGILKDVQIDTITIRTLADTLQKASLCVPSAPERESVDRVWNALRSAKHPRLNLLVPTSTVGMEYGSHIKPKVMLERIEELTAYSVSLCPDVEFSAEDATRSERDFLKTAIEIALRNGVKTITLCDTAGESLPQEITELIQDLRTSIPALNQATLSFQCRDSLGLGAANALAAVSAGAEQVKACCGILNDSLSMEQLIHLLHARESTLKIHTHVNTTALQRSCSQIERLMGMKRTEKSAFSTTVGSRRNENAASGEALTADSDLLTVRRRVEALGYDLEEKDLEQVFHQVHRLAAKKKADDRDLEAIIADNAQQVAPAYQLLQYVINSGNSIPATAFIKVRVAGEDTVRQSVSPGDGSIDAAFLAIEQVLGRHFELDDFQIQAVTEGREAMGDALVKLLHNGKLYSGHGLSTDIIGASISAYLNAVNKIVYEEKRS